MSSWDDMVLVGTVARPHGLRGHVVVNPETDFPDERFKPGASLWTRLDDREETLTVEATRLQNGRPVVAFEGYGTVEAAGRLVGRELRVPDAALHPLPDGMYYQHQLVGCVVETAPQTEVGRVVRVDGGSAGSLLVVDGTRGEVLIPLAAAICVEIDVEGRRIRIEPPDGLLDLNVTRRAPGGRAG
jgi:16S rRNA processing protein RimM